MTLVLLTGLLALAGCVVGPDYVPPEVEVPAGFHDPDDPALATGPAEVVDWWQVFDDPLLTKLIGLAASQNLDVKRAVARIKQARAQVGVVTGSYFPKADGSGEAVRQRTSENSATGGGQEFSSYSLGVSASWELDFFGRISRSVESAEASYQASLEDRANVMISLYSELAQTYLTLRTAQARLQAAWKNIDTQIESLKLTQARFDAGLATDLDISQAQTVLASSQAEVPPLRTQLVSSINTIAYLLGRAPGEMAKELSVIEPIPTPPPKVTVGIPANLLRRRPDIRKAERQLAAQTARIGLATADLYPTFSLTGNIGLSATDLDKLFNGGSRLWSAGPSLFWNLFAGGSIRSQIKLEEAATEELVYAYEQTVLNAYSEVENAVSSYVEQLVRVKALARSVDASQRYLDLALGLYKDGLTDFQNVLDAQRSLFTYDNQLAEARGQVSIYLVQLFLSLGGGWNPESLTPPAAEAQAAPEAPTRPAPAEANSPVKKD